MRLVFACLIYAWGLGVGVETDTDVALDTDKARGLNRFSYSRLFFILTIRVDARVQI